MSRFLRFTWRFCLLLLLLAILALAGFRWAAAEREVNDVGYLPPQGGALIETNEGAIYVLERGQSDGTPILFAHGTAAWSGLWLPTLEKVGAAGYRAIGYDLPPFGFSQHAADRDYARTRQADRILALIKAHNIRPIVVAHSFGAGPVAEAVMQDPDAFAGLIVVAGAIGLNSHDAAKSLPFPLRSDLTRTVGVAATANNPYLTARLLRSLIHIKSAATPETVAVLQQPMTRAGYTSAMADWLPSLLATPLNAQSTRPANWQNLDLPVVFIWGDADAVTTLAQAEALLAATPGATLTVMPDIGHIPQIEAPERFQAHLLSALARVTDAAR